MAFLRLLERRREGELQLERIGHAEVVDTAIGVVDDAIGVNRGVVFVEKVVDAAIDFEMIVEFPADGRVDEAVVVHLVDGASAIGVLTGADEHAADVQIELLDGIPGGVEANHVVGDERTEMLARREIAGMLPCVGEAQGEFVDGAGVDASFDTADFHLVNVDRIGHPCVGIIAAIGADVVFDRILEVGDVGGQLLADDVLFEADVPCAGGFRLQIGIAVPIPCVVGERHEFVRVGGAIAFAVGCAERRARGFEQIAGGNVASPFMIEIGMVVVAEVRVKEEIFKRFDLVADVVADSAVGFVPFLELFVVVTDHEAADLLMLEVDTGGQRVPIVDVERGLRVDEGEVANVAICAAATDANVFTIRTRLGVGEGDVERVVEETRSREFGMAHGLAEPDVVVVRTIAPIACVAVVVLFIRVGEGATEFDAPIVIELEAEIGEIVHGTEMIVIAIDEHGGRRAFAIDGDAAFTLAGDTDFVVDDGLAAIDDGARVKAAMAARFDVEDAMRAIFFWRLAGDDVDDAAERGAALQGDSAFHDFDAVDEIERDVVEHRGEAARL